MNVQRLLGIVLLIVGVYLLIVGLNASGSIANRFSSFFTGHFTDSTMWYILGGAASAVFGFMLVMFGGHRTLA